MKNNYVLLVWLISVLTSVQNIGQFCVGAISCLSFATFRENANKSKPSWLSNEAILAGCIGMSSAIFYTWIRFNPIENINIMFTKRYLLIPINLLSLSMLLSSQIPRTPIKNKEERRPWINLFAIGSINIILTLPFAKAILSKQEIIIYFCVVILSAAVASLLIRDSNKENRKAWAIIFSISILLLIFFCDSSLIAGVYISGLTLLICCKLQHTNMILMISKKLLLAMQSTGIYCFSIGLPILVITSPWITAKESNWASNALWTLTGSRYFLAWSYNLWGSEELGLRSIFNLNEQIPFLDTHTFYDKNLTKYYSYPFRSIEQVRTFLGHAHSDPIQRLLDITTGTSQMVLLSIASLLIIACLWWIMLVAFSEYTNKQEKNFKLFCLISNLAIIAYITTESLTPWQSILIFSSYAICLQQFYCSTEFSNVDEKKAINGSTHCHNIVNPGHPLMIIYPYLILLVVPAMTLITRSS